MSAIRISVPGRLDFIDLGPQVAPASPYLHGSKVIGASGTEVPAEREGRTPEHPARSREYQRQWRDDNREQQRAYERARYWRRKAIEAAVRALQDGAS